MGFSLFEHAETRGVFFAVNGAHVTEVAPQENAADGRPVSLLLFDFTPRGFNPRVIGTKQDIESLFREAAKVALMKADITILSGQKIKRAAPLLLNQPDRVALVREMSGEEVAAISDGSFVTASELFMADGKAREIVERPGTFVLKANVGSRVPLLKVEA